MKAKERSQQETKSKTTKGLSGWLKLKALAAIVVAVATLILIGQIWSNRPAKKKVKVPPALVKAVTREIITSPAMLKQIVLKFREYPEIRNLLVAEIQKAMEDRKKSDQVKAKVFAGPRKVVEIVGGKHTSTNARPQRIATLRRRDEIDKILDETDKLLGIEGS